MKTIKLKQIEDEKLKKGLDAPFVFIEQDLMSFYNFEIENISKYAIGPYFWFIPDNHTGNIMHISDSVESLTPFRKKDWLNPEVSFGFFANFIHPEDRSFVFSAIKFSTEMAVKSHISGQSIKVNIYGRFLNNKHEYRWMLMQFPKFYFDYAGNCQNLLSICTDIGHLTPQTSPMMTILEIDNENEQVFLVLPEISQMSLLPFPKISKREKQILALISKGLKTPQIAEQLFIAYSTVENHKKNLREKTNTKTSGELITFAIKHQLI